MDSTQQSMEFLLGFSEQLQAKLFSFTLEELQLFFHVNFWLRDEKNDQIVLDALNRFFPNRIEKQQEIFIAENGMSRIVSEDQIEKPAELQLNNPQGLQNDGSLIAFSDEAKKMSDAELQQLVQEQEILSNLEGNENESQNETQQKQLAAQRQMEEEQNINEPQPTDIEDNSVMLVFRIIEIAGNDQTASTILNELVRRFQNLNEGEKVKLDHISSSLPPSQSSEIINLLEQLGLFQANPNEFVLLGDLQRIRLFCKNATQELQNFNAVNSQPKITQQQAETQQTRAALTMAARDRRKQSRQDNQNTSRLMQESIQDQLQAYRSRMRQNQLSNNRAAVNYSNYYASMNQQSSQQQKPTNIMTLGRLEEVREDRFRTINEQKGNNSIQPGKTISLEDIQNMRNRERIRSFGLKALELTNQFRKTQGKPPVKWNEELTFIGKKHSEDMGEGRVPFGHEGFNSRVKQIGFSQRAAYENVAYCTEGYPDIPKTIVDGWINSPGHRKNLLSDSNVCGIAVYRTASGRWYFTQLLALKV